MMNPGAIGYSDFVQSMGSAAQSLLDCAEIKTPEDAMAHDLSEYLADFYQPMRNLAFELNCFYGAQINLEDEPATNRVDQTHDFVKITNAVNKFINNTPETAYGSDLFDNIHFNDGDSLFSSVQFLDCLDDTYDRLKVINLLTSTVKMHQLRLQIIAEQQAELIYQEIENSPLVTILASKFAVSSNDDGVTNALFDACLDVLESQQPPSQAAVRRNLFKQSCNNGFMSVTDSPDSIDAGLVSRFGKFVFDKYQSSQQDYQMRKKLVATLKEIPLAAPDKELADMIYERKVMQLRGEEAEHINYHPDCFRDYHYKTLVNRAEICLNHTELNQNSAWMSEYEKEPPLNKELIRDFKKLLKTWVIAENNICEQMIGDVGAAIEFTEHQEHQIKSTDYDNKLLQQTQNLVKTSEAVSLFMGIDLTKDEIGMKHLEAMKNRQKPLSNNDLQLIYYLALTFNANCRKKSQFNADKYVELNPLLTNKILALPNGEQKYKLLYYTHLGLRTIGAGVLQEQNAVETDCIDSLRGVHQIATDLLQFDMQEYFTNSVQADQLTNAVDKAVTKHCLLPLYHQEEPSLQAAQMIQAEIGEYQKLPASQQEGLNSLIVQHIQLSQNIHHQEIINQRELPAEFSADLKSFHENKEKVALCHQQLQMIETPLLNAQLDYQKYQRLSAEKQTVKPSTQVNKRLVMAMQGRMN